MPRANSLSQLPPDLAHAFNPTPTLSSNNSGPPSPSRPRALSKASSFADLRLTKAKIFKRFRGGSRELDFGCSGDAEVEIEEEDGEMEGEMTVQAKPSAHRPPLPSAPASFASLPPRPSPYQFPLHAPPSEEELRRLAREKEEQLAAEACLDYISTHSHSHARKSSRSSSLAHLDTTGLGPSLERLNLRRGSAQSQHDDVAVNRPRCDSIASSSVCSSRPRTNDSLPSFAESASTVDSTGSFPPSPVQSPTLRSRPTFANAYQPVKVDTEAVAHQSRSYAFI
ncbi:hypothetical protein JCM8547_004206 [Rhodosporidiobolus lusitaniae]